MCDPRIIMGPPYENERGIEFFEGVIRAIALTLIAAGAVGLIAAGAVALFALWG